MSLEINNDVAFKQGMIVFIIRRQFRTQRPNRSI